MIDWFQATVLALLQGLSEFLPISSSAHLVLPSLLFDWPDQGLAFDVAVHVGTLAAVLYYYRSDVATMTLAWTRSMGGAAASEDSRLAWYLVVATIPAGVIGLFARDVIELELRSLPVIASTTLAFGLLLGYADRRASRRNLDRTAEASLSMLMVLIIGGAQAMALVPGVSRSGATITMGLLLGLGRHSAARLSFLMSIPVIALAGTLKAWDLYVSDAQVDWFILGYGALVSGLTAYCCIAVFLRLLDRIGMTPFVYYRVFLALALYALWLL